MTPEHTVAIRPHWTGKYSTFFTLLAIGAVLLKVDDRLTLTLCALGALTALICTLIYVRKGLELLSHSGHTSARAPTPKSP